MVGVGIILICSLIVVGALAFLLTLDEPGQGADSYNDGGRLG